MQHVIVGLGNPGVEYERTRHNVGRVLVERFAKREGRFAWQEDKYLNALVATDSIDGEGATLLLPETYMNRSGESVKALYKRLGEAMPPIVVYDDVDLPLGRIKVSFGRGSGGHNGLASIIDAFKGTSFPRVRIGISPVSFFGNMKKPRTAETFVLKPFSSGEQRKIDDIEEDVSRALKAIIMEGHEAAMNRFNTVDSR